MIRMSWSFSFGRWEHSGPRNLCIQHRLEEFLMMVGVPCVWTNWKLLQALWRSTLRHLRLADDTVLITPSIRQAERWSTTVMHVKPLSCSWTLQGDVPCRPPNGWLDFLVKALDERCDAFRYFWAGRSHCATLACDGDRWRSYWRNRHEWPAER